MSNGTSYNSPFTAGLMYNPQTGGWTSPMLGGVGQYGQAPAQGQQTGPSVLAGMEGGGPGQTTFRIPGIYSVDQGSSTEPSIYGLGTRWLNPQQGSSVGSLFGGWMPETRFEAGMNAVNSGALPPWSARGIPTPGSYGGGTTAPRADIYDPSFSPYRSVGAGGVQQYSDRPEAFREIRQPPPTLSQIATALRAQYAPEYRPGYD